MRTQLPLEVYSAGIQVSRGTGGHMDRYMGCFDLLFVRRGMLPIQEENQAFQVVAGQTLLLWPHRHHWGTGKFSDDMVLYWLHFDVAQTGQLPPSKQFQIEEKVDVPQYATVTRPDVLESYFRRFLDDQATGCLQPHSASLLVNLMLCEIARPPVEQVGTGQKAVLAGQALAYIRAHLHMSLTASFVAEQMGYQGDYLNRVFQQTYHHTLTHEIHLSRMGYARWLLLHSSQSIKEIALSCGFSDANYFARLFKRYEGVTAVNFRRLHAQAEVNYD
ncbi:AraC family transcriptional regulator [bacterium]|nr:MAG: AraC family transcriptional regulator [bacterium]